MGYAARANRIAQLAKQGIIPPQPPVLTPAQQRDRWREERRQRRLEALRQIEERSSPMMMRCWECRNLISTPDIPPKVVDPPADPEAPPLPKMGQAEVVCGRCGRIYEVTIIVAGKREKAAEATGAKKVAVIDEGGEVRMSER